MFDSLRRWAHGQLADGEIPAEVTVAAMDAAGVRTGMLCAWWGPRGPLISNDAVAAMVRAYPGRFAGSRRLTSPATKYPNVYIDTSAYKSSRYPGELVDYLRHHGRHKVLFGSNHPAWPAADCLRDLDGLQLDRETAEAFLHGNAERVFGLTSRTEAG